MDLLWATNGRKSGHSQPAHSNRVSSYTLQNEAKCQSVVIVLGVPVVGTDGGRERAVPERPETVGSPLTSSSFSK